MKYPLRLKANLRIELNEERLKVACRDGRILVTFHTVKALIQFMIFSLYWYRSSTYPHRILELLRSAGWAVYFQHRSLPFPLALKPADGPFSRALFTFLGTAHRG